MFKKIKDFDYLSQVLFLLFVFFLPNVLDVYSRIEPQVKSAPINFEEFIYYLIFIALKLGNWGIGIIASVSLLFCFRITNKDKFINRGKEYHKHSYLYYWVAAKIFNYRTCNLANVPIYMQFKLVLSDMFDKYEYGPIHTSNADKISIKGNNDSKYTDTINLVLSDTYKIELNALPECVTHLTTLEIDRSKDSDMNRYYSEDFIKFVQQTVKELPASIVKVNLFATLNPKNSYHIAKEVFSLPSRNSIKSLSVFQQQDESRKFETRGHRIY